VADGHFALLAKPQRSQIKSPLRRCVSWPPEARENRPPALGLVRDHLHYYAVEVMGNRSDGGLGQLDAGAANCGVSRG
jgi:hypothetical protein